MAVDVCSTPEISITPRISFSHDLNNPSPNLTDPTRSDQFLLSPSFNFNFNTTSNLTPADELFSNGKILPTQIKTPQIIQIQKDPNPITQIKPLKEEQVKSTSISRSFWQFTRSVSLNCDNNSKGPKGLLRSLSIKSLSRSNSTGSGLIPKRNSGQKVDKKSTESMFLRRCSSFNQSPPSSNHVYYTFRNPNSSKSCKGGIRINPVLNVNISMGTVKFFGCGSLFCNGKVKKKSKT